MERIGLDASRFAAIYAGGVLGALARVGLSELVPHDAGAWPWATLIVNLAGALALGYLAARFHDRREEDVAHPFLTAGLCGTLTTFATVQLELFEMLEAGRIGLALAYAGVTLAAGYSLLMIGRGIGIRREAT
jgi:CrcB protein